MKKRIAIEDPKSLKKGDILVCTEHGGQSLSGFTKDKEYPIQGFYDGGDGIVLISDRNTDNQICNDLVKKLFNLLIEEPDNVNHPPHYTSHPSGIECIEITRHYCFAIGNAIKYLWRAGLKKDVSLSDSQKEIEDLKKAIWYIKDRIKQLGGEIS